MICLNAVVIQDDLRDSAEVSRVERAAVRATGVGPSASLDVSSNSDAIASGTGFVRTNFSTAVVMLESVCQSIVAHLQSTIRSNPSGVNSLSMRYLKGHHKKKS